MSNGIEIKNLPSATTIKQNDTMTIVQNRENKQLPLDRFANESDLATLSVLENRCDEVKAKIEVDEYSAEITTSQSMSEIGSDDSGANLHENVLDGAFESCVLKGKTKYRDIDTGEILEDFEEGRNLELITVRMPILSTVGKNLLSPQLLNSVITQSKQGYAGVNFNYNSSDGSFTVTGTFTNDVTLHCNGEEFIKLLKHGVTYQSSDKMLFEVISSDGNNKWVNNFTFDKNKHIRVSPYYQWNGVIGTTINETYYPQIEVDERTAYEPYKTSILSFNQKDDKTIVLRSLPDGTCDTLNVETGEYVQKIGERNYQDGDTNSNTLVTDGTKTQYKLSSPITTKVDVQGFPHAYKNGHIQLSSGSTEPSLTPTVTYKVPVSRVGQIASNTKSNLRQTIKLDQLEILAYQSLINAEYENLLVQNSAESAASFTNLSTNDPKDELYYMLKHLIEENQPVQNMLDKINLFYLYGLLNDEHYFDLLLGGEEDVY